MIAFSYAETVTEEMRIVFNSTQATIDFKTTALTFAIEMSIACNRFAAMDACSGMIKSVSDEGLGMAVAELIKKYSEHGFIHSIEPTTCSSQAVRNRLSEIRKAQTTSDDLF